MKADTFKKLIKEVILEALQDEDILKKIIREVFREELKDILLESIKSNKTVVKESYSPPISSTPPPSDLRSQYASLMDTLEDTATKMHSPIKPKFDPRGVDPINGSLGEGEVGMDVINTLLTPSK